MTERTEKSKLKLVEDTFWHQLANLGGDGNPHEPPEATGRQYWNAYFKAVGNREDATDENYVERHSVLSEVDFVSLSNLIYDFSKKDKIDYWNPPGKIDFSQVRFGDEVNFANFTFPWSVSFENAVFESFADFRDATFTAHANFSDATFTGIADFRDASFTGNPAFRKATFADDAAFIGATFTGFADFRKATFTGFALYIDARFTENALFNKATFKDTADFKSANFNTTTNFTKTKFLKHPPAFFDANVSQDTIWQDTTFPKPPSDKDEAHAHKRAYERLSLMMSRLEKSHDKHMFFRHEMRMRRRLETNWFSIFMNGAYALFSNYGYGFGRALAWWFGHIFLGACLLFIPAPQNWAGVVNSVATSFANAHSFLGLNRGPLKTVYADYAKWDFFNVVWTVQGLLGILFLFFLILTIRNRFKMG